MIFWIAVFKALSIICIMVTCIVFMYKEIFRKEGNIFMKEDFSPYRNYLKNLKNIYASKK